MKNVASIFIFLILIVCADKGKALFAQAQYKPHFYLQYNGGLSYLQNDTPIWLRGRTAGLTLGHISTISKKLGIEIGGRGGIQIGTYYGLEGTPSRFFNALPGSSSSAVFDAYGCVLGFDCPDLYFNHRTFYAAAGGELTITAHNLRRKTGIVLSSFAGFNVNMSRPMVNQLNGSESYLADYQRLQADTSLSPRQVRRELRRNVLDNSFETASFFEEESSFNFTAGIELGYDISPSWSVGVGHRATVLYGMSMNGKLPDDHIGHYSYLHVTQRFLVKKKEKAIPEINFIEPDNSPFLAPSAYYAIRAEVNGVKSAKNLRLLQNGKQIPFDFHRKTLSAPVFLDNGDNVFEIRATNDGGQASAITVIRYEEPKDSNKVVIRLIQPSSPSVSTEATPFRAVAEILHVRTSREINVFLNDKALSRFMYDQNTGQLNVSLPLQRGNNTLRVEAQNSLGRVSSSAMIQYNAPAKAPEISMINPSKLSLFTSDRQIRINAKIIGLEKVDQITLRQNGNLIPSNKYSFLPASGQFVCNVNLNIGENNFDLTAKNEAGTDVRTFNITVARNLPEVNITNLRQISSSATSCIFEIEAQTRYLGSNPSIRVNINGATVRNFDYNSTSGLVRLTHQMDENRIDAIIEVENQFGKDSDRKFSQCVFTSIPIPQISNISPLSRSNIRKGNNVISAKIIGVNSSEQIEFSVNGNINRSFSFDPSSGIFSANLVFETGSATISWRASNSGGTGEATATYTVLAPKLPTIRLVNPPDSIWESSQSNLRMEAIVQNVKVSSDIKVFVNGRRQLPILFDAGNGRLAAELRLSPGVNKLRIDASNPDGTSTAQATMNVRPVNKLPIVRILSASQPTSNPMEPDVARSTIIAEFERISSSSEIRFLLNNVSDSNFEYNTTTGQLIKTVNLRRGKNLIRIEARTLDGEASDEIEIMF
jgi:hypothetical protein